jgi:hypothetical protein
MPETELKFSEIAVLMVLMVEADEISNPDLKARYGGLSLDGKSRLKLNDLKLVESRKVGRAFVHLLTDDGWARMAREIQSDIPVPSGASGAMNRAFLSWLRGFLARTGRRPGDIFLPQGDQAALSPEAESGIAVEEEAGEGAVIERIRAAYTRLAAEPGDLVTLARLRPLLGEFARAEVDGALKGMLHLPEVSIVPEHNQKVLTSEVRTAAVTIGDQDKHLISIGAR